MSGLELLHDAHQRCGAPAASRRLQSVDNVVFLASHTSGCRAGDPLERCMMDHRDLALYRLYSRELQSQPKTSFWAILLHSGYDKMSRVQLTLTKADKCCQACAENIIAYGEQAVWRMYPRLGEAVKAHPDIQEWESRGQDYKYIGFYHWFHASMAMWYAQYGNCFHELKYVWRLEPDVLWTGTIDTLISLASEDTTSDVLLPTTWTENKSFSARKYQFFLTQPFLKFVPDDCHVYTYVSVGRYSTKFLFEIMDRLWKDGVVGYEEVFLPSACLNTSGCQLGLLNGWTSAAANHVVYRVLHHNDWEHAETFSCEDYLAARRASTLDLWHPVKNLTCLLGNLGAHLGMTTGQGCPPFEVFEQPANSSDLRLRSIEYAEKFDGREQKYKKYNAFIKAREQLARIATLDKRDAHDLSLRGIRRGFPPLNFSFMDGDPRASQWWK